MNRKKFDKIERREVTKRYVEDALRQVLVSEQPKRPRSENREPSKKELEKRHRLDRERGTKSQRERRSRSA